MLNHFLTELFRKIKHCPMCGAELKTLEITVPPLKLCPRLHGLMSVTNDGPPPAAGIFVELEVEDIIFFEKSLRDAEGKKTDAG